MGNAKLGLYCGNDEKISNLPVKDGQLIISKKDENTADLYVDISNADGTQTRIKVGGCSIDNNLSETSENPVQNKVVTQKINEILNLDFVGTTEEFNQAKTEGRIKDGAIIFLTDDEQ